jgi:hypothetical protein
MDGRRKVIPVDSLLQLRQRLDCLPPKSPERAIQIATVAKLYGISTTTVYRALYAFRKPHSAYRADHGKPRLLPQSELERYCELIAALKLRTTNKQGRHLSTGRAIELMEDYGVETAHGLVKAPKVYCAAQPSITICSCYDWISLACYASHQPFDSKLSTATIVGNLTCHPRLLNTSINLPGLTPRRAYQP